jgi:hypothetical protein
VKVTIHVYLVQRLRMSGAIPLLPLYAFVAWTGKTLLFACLGGKIIDSERKGGKRSPDSLCRYFIHKLILLRFVTVIQSTSISKGLAMQSCIFKSHFNIPSTPGFCKGSPFLRFSHQNPLVYFCTMRATRLAHNNHDFISLLIFGDDYK